MVFLLLILSTSILFICFMNWFCTRVSEDRKYLCGRRLCGWINTRKFKDLYSREITSTWSTLSSDRIRRPIRFGTALNLIFSKLSSQNMRGFDHATIFSPSFHGFFKERLAQWSLICVLNTTKTPGGTSWKIGWGCAARFLKPLPYFRPKSVIFPTLFQTWSKTWYPISNQKPWSPARDLSGWQAVTASTR